MHICVVESAPANPEHLSQDTCGGTGDTCTKTRGTCGFCSPKYTVILTHFIAMFIPKINFLTF